MSYYKASLLLCGVIIIIIGYLLILHTPQLLAYGCFIIGATLIGTIIAIRSKINEIPHADIEDELELLTGYVLQENLTEETKNNISQIQTIRKKLPQSTEKQLLTFFHAKLLGQAKFKTFPNNIEKFLNVLENYKNTKILHVQIKNEARVDL